MVDGASAAGQFVYLVLEVMATDVDRLDVLTADLVLSFALVGQVPLNLVLRQKAAAIEHLVLRKEDEGAHQEVAASKEKRGAKGNGELPDHVLDSKVDANHRYDDHQHDEDDIAVPGYGEARALDPADVERVIGWIGQEGREGYVDDGKPKGPKGVGGVRKKA